MLRLLPRLVNTGFGSVLPVRWLRRVDCVISVGRACHFGERNSLQTDLTGYHGLFAERDGSHKFSRGGRCLGR